jgi:hypothetical protein
MKQLLELIIHFLELIKSKLNIQRILALTLFVLSLGLYFIQGLEYSKHMYPMMDEGSYLLKGLYYLKGIYSPYQDYGPVTNKPPFSFYSLGFSQIIEPGLRSGRYFAVLIGLGTLLGLWLTIKRLFNIWWATWTALLVSVSIALIMYSSKAMTQTVTAFLIVWTLFFIFGKDRKLWQLCLGSIIAVFLPLTRQNLLPLYFLLLFFIVWAHGKRGWLAIGLSLVIFCFAFIYYWPGLFSTYVITFFPKIIGNSILSYLHIGHIGNLDSIFTNTERSVIQETSILFQGIRNFLVPMIASLVLLIAIPYRNIIKDKYGKECLFLLTSFIIMVGIHFYAVVTENILINNFPSYIAFFWPLGIILVPFSITFTNRNNNKNIIVLVLTCIAILLLFSGLGYSLFEVTSDTLLHLQIPRFKDMHFLPGTIEISRILTDKLNLTFRSQRHLIGLLSGFIFGIVFLIIIMFIRKLVRVKFPDISYARTAFSGLLLFGLIATPTKLFSGDPTILICNSGDILYAQEKVGLELNNVIPKNSLVYLEYETPISLLYIHDVRVFPPQINKYFYYRIGGNDQELEKYGYWNENLSNKWLNEADYLIIGGSNGNAIRNILVTEPEKFTLLKTTSKINPCIDKSKLKVYKVNK